MNKILISYQINENSQTFDYTHLYGAIGSYHIFAKAMNSCYLIKTIATPTQVYDNLVQYIDWDDNLLCVELQGYYKGRIPVLAINLLDS